MAIRVWDFAACVFMVLAWCYSFLWQLVDCYHGPVKSVPYLIRVGLLVVILLPFFLFSFYVCLSKLKVYRANMAVMVIAKSTVAVTQCLLSLKGFHLKAVSMLHICSIICQMTSYNDECRRSMDLVEIILLMSLQFVIVCLINLDFSGCVTYAPPTLLAIWVLTSQKARLNSVKSRMS